MRAPAASWKPNWPLPLPAGLSLPFSPPRSSSSGGRGNELRCYRHQWAGGIKVLNNREWSLSMRESEPSSAPLVTEFTAETAAKPVAVRHSAKSMASRIDRLSATIAMFGWA